MTKSVKNIIITFLVGVIVFAIGNLIDGGFNFDNPNEFFTEFAFYQLYSFVLGYSNMYFFDYLENFKWKKYIGAKRIIIGIIGSVIITLVCLFFLRYVTEVYYSDVSFLEFIKNEKLSNYNFGLWITLNIILIFHAIYFYNRYQQRKLKSRK